MITSQIQELQAEIRKLCTEKGWREGLPANPRNPTEPFAQYVLPAYLDLAVSELTEVLEAYRDKVWTDTRCTCDPGPELQHHPYCEQKPIGVGPELADALIRILDICDIWGIDIEYELKRVLAYGWTRPYKHGGRQL